MSDLVGNPEDRFSRVEAQFILMIIKNATKNVNTIENFEFAIA